MHRRTFIKLPALLTLPHVAQTQQMLIAFGDSITAGAGLPDGHSYATLVATTLGFTLDNRAIGGSMITEQLINAIAPYISQPSDSIVFLTGYNDLRHGTAIADYITQLDGALTHLCTNGARVFVGGCLPMTDAGYVAYGPEWNHGTPALCAAYTAAITAACATHGATFVDVTRYYAPANVLDDLVHPNDAGHAQIAAAFLAVMQPHLYLPLIGA